MLSTNFMASNITLDHKQKVYLNGTYVPADEAKISVMTHALQYGTGCFEGIRAYYNETDDCLYAFGLKEHFQRLKQSAKILFITIPHTVDELCEITVKLLQHNFDKTDIYIRPFIYKSDLAVGNFNLAKLQDGFCVYTLALGRYYGGDNGLRVKVSSWMRIPDNSIPPRAKITGSYINTALAKTEAGLEGYDDALFLDKNGQVVEGSAANFFMVKNNTLITPSVTSDILEGITRKTISQIAKDLGITIQERSIGRSEIYQADEVFLSGTGVEVCPVTEIDRRVIGTGKIGVLTKQLKEEYYKIVHGENPTYKNLLTKVTKK